MGATSSIRLYFPMRKSTLLPYPDRNDRGRKFPSRTFTQPQRLDDQTYGRPIFFSSTLRRFSVSACMIVGERIGNIHTRTMDGRFFFHFLPE